MSVHHLQSCLSKDLANLVILQLSEDSNQAYISENVIDPILNKVFIKLRGVVLTIGVLLSALILLNTLIIIHTIYNRKR